jgi:hypothetical protein
LEVIAAGVLAEALRRTPEDHHVIWTGHSYASWQRSLRSRALAEIKECGVPVSLRELLRRAARIDGDRGLDPDTVRAGVRLHQGAKPAVYLLVQRTSAGDYVAVTEIPSAGPDFRRVARGPLCWTERGD